MEKKLVLMTHWNKIQRAAPIGAAHVVALRHCEAPSLRGTKQSSPDELSWNLTTLNAVHLLRKEIFQNQIKIFQKS